MPFVQVTRVKGVSKDQYERIREQATGGKLLDGELFFVDGYQGDELWAIDGWETREQCDRGMNKWGPAMAAEGVSMDGMNLEEFEIDSLLLSGATHRHRADAAAVTMHAVRRRRLASVDCRSDAYRRWHPPS
jgi:hypothetical protein